MAITTGVMLAMAAGVSVAGQLAQGQAARRAGAAQAAQDERLAAQQRDQALQEAERIRKAGDRTAGAARAQMAANGVDVNSGTGLLVEQEIVGNAEKDAMNTLLTGQRQSDASMFNASQARARGRAAQRASVLGAVSTGLSAWKGVSAEQAPAVVDGGYSVGQGSAYGGNRRGL